VGVVGMALAASGFGVSLVLRKRVRTEPVVVTTPPESNPQPNKTDKPQRDNVERMEPREMQYDKEDNVRFLMANHS
jgi:hypothetical protein